MKVIDLFLMEDKPKKIKVDGLEYESCLCNDCNSKLYTEYSHFNPKTKTTSLFWARYLFTNQNAEVEVLEEDKEIEELDFCKIDDETILGLVQSVNELNHEYIDKINELIKAVNELRKGE